MKGFSSSLLTLLLLTQLVSCGGGGSGDSGGTSPTPQTNVVPISSAGADQNVDEQISVSLTGSGTDSDGTIASYTWTQTSGEAVTLSGADAASASFNAPVTTTQLALTFQLTVTDNDGATAIDSVDVMINPVNANPTASAGNDRTVDEQSNVTLSGSATDTDGEIASYRWTQTAGISVSINNGSAAESSFTAPITTTPIDLTFQLTVTDNEDATVSDSVVITINPVNENPTASAGNDRTVNEQSNVILSGSATDTDGEIVSYSWTQTAGISVSINNGCTAESSFTAPITTTPIDLTFQLTVTDNEDATASHSVVITVKPIVVVIIEQSTVDIAMVSSGAFGEVVVVDGIASIDITTVTGEGLVTAYDADDNIIWMGYITVGDETITLNADTTTMALMLLVPNLVIFNNDQSDVFQSFYDGSQSVADLSTYLSNNNDWYQLSQEFTDLYSAAVLSLFNQINPIGTQIAAKASGSSKPQNAVIVVNEDEDGEITTNYSQTLNGIEVKVDNITTAGKEDLFSIEVTNKLNRWVGIAIGPDPETYSGSPATLPSGNVSYIHKGKNDTAKFEDELDKLDDDPETTTYGIYVYGPATDDFWGSYAEGRFANDLHGNATAYTLLFELAIPVFGKALGAETCLVQMFDPTKQTYGIAAQIISSQNIQSYLTAGKTDSAALEIGGFILDSIKSTGIGCLKDIALKQLERLIKVIAQAQIITSLYDVYTTADDVYQTIKQSKGQTSWEVSNRINMSFHMIGIDYLAESGWGSVGYIEAENISGDYIERYPGTCAATETNKCEGYTFAPESPMVVAYTLKCIDPVTEDFTPCVSGMLEPEMIEYDSNEQGEIVFERNYSQTGEKEYTHTFNVYDEAGAVNQYTASVQIKRATPQLVLRVRGKELESSLDESANMSNINPYTLVPQSGVYETVTFELYNKGNADAKVSIGTRIDSSSFELSNLTPDASVPILPGESKTFDITYTANGDGLTGARFLFIGTLGDENVDSKITHFKRYSRMDLLVNIGIPPPPKFTMSEPQCTDNALIAWFDWRVESLASGTTLISTTNTNPAASTAARSFGWYSYNSDIFGGITVQCTSQVYSTRTGGTLNITLTDEFGQTVEINKTFEECPLGDNGPFVWTECAEYN